MKRSKGECPGEMEGDAEGDQERREDGDDNNEQGREQELVHGCQAAAVFLKIGDKQNRQTDQGEQKDGVFSERRDRFLEGSSEEGIRTENDVDQDLASSTAAMATTNHRVWVAAGFCAPFRSV